MRCGNANRRKRWRVLVVNIHLIILIFVVSMAVGDEHEYRLYGDLMKNYNRLERPVSNNSQPVTVNLGLILQQIVGVDEKNQIIEVNAWIKYTWTDYKLKWKPEEYGGVTDVRFPVDMLWRPDVLVYNSADKEFDSTFPSNIVVYNDGSILWIPPGILRTSCKIDIRWFPFDDQSCHIKFGSWTYHGFALDLRPEDEKNGADISEYMTNGEWLLLSTPVTREEKFYECCPEPYVDVKFYLNIRRRTLYYGFNLIIPSLLISLMTVLGFTLPPDAGEKITLEITILLSVCFFLSIVADMTPPTSEAVPLIGTFFTCCMVVVSASVVFTVVVLNLHYRTPDTHEMSPFCRTILLNWMPWMLMMRRPGHTFTPPPLFSTIRRLFQMRNSSKSGSESLIRNVRNYEHQTTTIDKRLAVAEQSQVVNKNPKAYDNHQKNNTMYTSTTLDATMPSELNAKCKYSNRHVAGSVDSTSDNENARLLNVEAHRRTSQTLDAKAAACLDPILNNPSCVDPGVHALIVMLQRIHTELKFIVTRMEKADVDEDAIADWKFAAMVVDRVCLIVFSAFIVASTCGIMFSAPHVAW